MRNPGQTSEQRDQGEMNSEACANDSERDDCDSPPCKRLKQAVLPFSVLPSPSLTSPGLFKPLVSSKSTAIGANNSESKSPESCEKVPQANGGLVTGAPSPPDVKDNSVKPQISTDTSKVSKNLGLENKEDGTSRQRDLNSISSPESNSSHNEDEFMIIDQSPPAKIDINKKITDNRRTPVLKSAEKLKRKEEREKERQEKQRLREEKLKEKQEAKAVKERERLEAKRKRDQEKQEKQAEKERKEKERVEKKEKEEKERLEKREKKDEEKRKREEEKSAKIEEKRKREEEKRNIEEQQERKRLKTKENFASFFTKTSTLPSKTTSTETSTQFKPFVHRFKPFEPKKGMSVAPVIRKLLSVETKRLLDEGLQHQEGYKPYLRELQNRKPIIKYTKRRLTVIEEQPGCDSDEKMPEGAIDVDDENSNLSVEIIEKKSNLSSAVGLKCKLLQFHTNYRPAYYGTWRKRSKQISPKNPFKKDMDLLDYEVDSDDEWEEEEPGESLSNSEGEDEADGDDDNDDDDGFFVPHGYLSDDEGVEDGEDDDGEENEENKDNNCENKKDQQLAKAKAWEAEMKRKCKPMKPVTLGCLWLQDASLNFTLKQFAACLLVDGPVNVESSVTSSKSNEVAPGDVSSSTSTSGALYVPDEAMPDLITLVHGNTAGLNKIMSQFRKHWTAKCLGRAVTDEEVDEKSPISKRQLEKRIQNIATKERRSDRLRWYVHSHILATFGLENLLVIDGVSSSDASTETAKIPIGLHTNTPSITQFTRPVSPALNKGLSSELNNHIPDIKPSRPPLDNSTSPMEVESSGSSLHGTNMSDCSNSANSHLFVESKFQSKNTTQMCNKPGLIQALMTGTDKNSSGMAFETVCVDSYVN